MMKIKYIVVIVALGIAGCMYSQNMSNQHTFVTTQLAQLNNNPNLLVSNQGLETSQQNIGSVIKVNQLGNLNVSDLRAGLNDSQLVNQIGDKNNYTFINYFNSNPSNMNILQQGNGNFLQIYGQNNLMSRISIIQKSNAKTLIIKNY